MKKILFYSIMLWANHAAAQCPYYATCPSGTPLYCDYSTNDTLYWNAAPFTWNPGLMLSDLPEANTDLGIVARDSCGGQNISVEYTLFLDLDGNDTTETVIKSNAAPPSGKVLYNNLLSPNYALGDTIEFDHRTGEPDSMKYRFGLQLNRIADLVIADLKWTTGIESLNYSTPKFPLGKHRIVWRIEQGGVERFCEYGFEVRDCAAPVVSCANLPGVNLLPTGNISLWASDFVQSATDNATPSNLLVLAVRISGWGTGFPLDDQGNPQEFVTFDCCNLGAQGIELWIKDKAGNVSQCSTYIIVQDGIGNCPSEGCGGDNQIYVCSETEVHDGVEEMHYLMEAMLPFPPFIRVDSLENNCGSFYFIPLNSDIVITPSKNDNLLNGVTTYDLVLMSKHILAIEPLNTPYKIIAADANKSGSITTFDIVEIRKLILGIYNSFPFNTSWRFVDKAFSFPNAQNPFQTAFPETVVLQDWSGSPDQFEFVGLKVGDVNNTAIPNASIPPPVESRTSSFLAFPDIDLKAGETYEIPVCITDKNDWLGLQFSLDYNPKLLDIETIASTTLPDFNQSNWAQPQPGRINLSWSAAQPVSVLPSSELLRLRIKARSDVRLSDVFKTPVISSLSAEAYDAEGNAHPLHFVFSEKEAGEAIRIFSAQPNPTTAGVSLPIQLSQAENLQLEVRDLTGRLIWSNKLYLDMGSHALEIPANALPQAGVYIWHLKAGQSFKTGKITKI